MMKTRYQMATILGYASWADYNAADKMIQQGGNIADFIEKVNQAARPVTRAGICHAAGGKEKDRSPATEISATRTGT